MNKLTSMQCGNVTMLFMVVMLMDSGVGALLQGAQRGVEQHLSTGVIEDTQNAINLGETKNEQLPTATVVGETQIEQPHTPIVAQSHPTAAEFLSEHGDGQLDIASARKMEKKTQHATAKAKLTGNGCSGGGCGKAVSDEHDTSVNPDSASIDTKIGTALSVVTEMWTGVGIGEATAMKVGVPWAAGPVSDAQGGGLELFEDQHNNLGAPQVNNAHNLSPGLEQSENPQSSLQAHVQNPGELPEVQSQDQKLGVGVVVAVFVLVCVCCGGLCFECPAREDPDREDKKGDVCCGLLFRPPAEKREASGLAGAVLVSVGVVFVLCGGGCLCLGVGSLFFVRFLVIGGFVLVIIGFALLWVVELRLRKREGDQQAGQQGRP